MLHRGRRASLKSNPDFEYVTMLLKGDGTNGAQNNTFVDESASPATITRNGNITQGTFTPSGTNWSNYFDGTGDNISFPSNAAFQFGTGNFCIEAWVFLTGNSTANPDTVRMATICSAIAPTSIGNDFWFIITGNTTTTGTGVQLRAFNSGVGTTIIDRAFTISQGVWHHIAVTRSGNDFRIFFNGVQQGATATSTLTVTGGTNPLLVGMSQTGAINYKQEMLGYISNLRIVKGSAVYTSDFTPSTTTPLTAISGTSLLTCQSSRFVDNSSNNFSPTVTGNVEVRKFGPFVNPSGGYLSATDGGSLYSDGNADYLSLADATKFNLAGGTYTIEGWFYWNGDTSTFRAIIAKRIAGTSTTAWQIYLAQTTGYIGFYDGVQRVSTVKPIPYSWNYFAAVWDGTNINVYLNGTRVVATAATNVNQAAAVTVASYPTTNENFGGYLASIRITKGAALYSGATMTVPAYPLTTTVSAGTVSLLLNSTNGGIIDSAKMNNLETVGNVQLSTSVKKYGSSSIAFDGTGDYLTFPGGERTAFGLGDFTIELWTYFNNANATFFYFMDNRNAGQTTNWAFYRNASNNLEWYTGSAGILGTGSTIAAAAWHHIAYCRSGTTGRLFLNGTQVGTGTDSTNYSVLSTISYIGSRYNATEQLNGYIDDLRITKKALYTANFTVPGPHATN